MSKKKASDFLWVEKFRPTRISETILPKKFRNFFEKVVKEEQIPNLLLYSSNPGSGKTSIAKALCKEIEADYIFINISGDSGIETLRSTIREFASTKSFNKRPKVVIMDEADGASPQLQAGLRAFIEEFHSHCRFILTCNYISKIIKPLREGRIMEFDFNMIDNETREELIPIITKRLLQILEFEKIQADVNVVEQLVEKSYPNIRKMISTLQKASTMFGIIDNNLINTVVSYDELFKLVLDKKFTLAREFIVKNSYNFDELFTVFFKDFVPLISEKQKQANIILILAQYQHMHALAIDSELNFSACLLEIIGAL